MKFRKTAVALAAAGLVSIGSSAFATTYQVDVGSNTSGDHLFHAASTSPGISFVVHHSGTDVNMTCESVEAEGNIHAGRSARLATIQSVTWPTGTSPHTDAGTSYADNFASTKWLTCKGPFGLDMSVQQNLDWDIVGNSGATTGTSDSITGQVTGVNAHVWATSSPGMCSFDVTGAANGTFHESGQTLDVNETAGNLKLSGITATVNDCFGLVATGDTADFVGSFNVHSFDGLVNVKP